MGRRTKAEIEKEKLPGLLEDIKKYIFTNGKVVTKNFAYWDNYPTCVKDVCVVTVGVIDNKIVYGDYDEEKKEFSKIMHTQDDLEYRFILESFEEMKEYDDKHNKKKIKS